MKGNRVKNKLILLLICFWIGGFAQYTKRIAELKRELSHRELQDTGRVRVLIQLADLISITSNDSSFMYASMAYELSKKMGYKHGIQWGLNAMGIIKIRRHAHDSAITFLDEALKISREFPTKIGEANILNNFGQLYFDKGDFPKALDNYFKALKLAQEKNDENLEAVIISNIGLVQYVSFERQKAEEYFLRSLEIRQRLRDTAGIGLDLGNLGNLYYRQGEQLKSEGKTDSAVKLFEKALTFLIRGMNVSIKYNNKALITGAMGNIGNVYYGMGKTDEAIDYYKRALRLDLDMKNFGGAMNHYNNIGWVLYEIKNYKESEIFTKRAISIADSIKSIRMLFNLYENLSLLYEETGQYESALGCYKKFIAAKDSVFNLENAKKSVEAEMNFEMEKKEVLIAESANKQRAVRNSLIFGFALLLLLVVVAFRGYRQKKKINQLISEQKSAVKKQKEMVEMKNKEITDSIHYAKRIQQSLLPSENVFEKGLKGS
jgi:tetratricopeptide (TPR) repeat protein